MSNSTTPNIDDVIADVYSLRPVAAAHHRNGDRRRLCVTSVYDTVVWDGKVIHLRRARKLQEQSPSGDIWTDEGKYGAGYVRVSTVKQQGKVRGLDGHSIDQQVTAHMRYFVGRGESFAIYSDAALSGGLAHDDPSLIRALAEKRASYYREAFDAIFLSGAFPGREVALKTYLERRLREELRNCTVDEVDKEDEVFDLDLSGRRLGKATYRPALTIALNEDLKTLHTIALTDQDRLARSLYLILAISSVLRASRVNVVGTIYRLDHLLATTLQDEMKTMLDGIIAQYTLAQVRYRVLSGQVGMLAAKRAAALPFWLTKDAETKIAIEAVLPAKRKGNTRCKEQVRGYALARYMCWLRWRHRWGTDKIAKHFGRLGIPSSREEQQREDGRPSGSWSQQSIDYALSNPALIGEYRHFGITWPDIVPRVISDQTFTMVEEASQANSEQYSDYRAGGKRSADHLLTGLIVCPICGFRLRFIPVYPKNGDVTGHYTCCPSRRSGATPQNVPEHSITLPMKQIEPIFDRVFRLYGHVILDQYKHSKKYDEVRAVLDRTEAQLALAIRERHLAAATAEEAVKSDAAEREQAGKPVNEQILNAIRAALLIESDNKVRHLENEVRAARYRLANMPAAKMDGVEEALARWNDLTMFHKNAVIKTLLREIRYEVIWAESGEIDAVHTDPKPTPEDDFRPVSSMKCRSQLVMITNALDADELEPIRLNGTIATSGRVTLKCEKAEEWLSRALMGADISI